MISFITPNGKIYHASAPQSSVDAAIPNQPEDQYANLYQFDRNSWAWSIPLDAAKSAKRQEIIQGANEVNRLLVEWYSRVEEDRWPEQEAGARSILGSESDVKNIYATVILNSPNALAQAVQLIEDLAAADGTTKEDFSQRVITNADSYAEKSQTTAIEQREMEAAVRTAAETSSEAVLSVVVSYSVLASLEPDYGQDEEEEDG